MGKLKIAILTRNAELYSHRRLREAAEKRGHEIRILNPRSCYMNIASDYPEIHYRGGEVLTGIDAVIPRIGASQTFYGAAVVRQFEMLGIYTLNNSIAISRSRDKLRSLQLLSRKKIAMPKTGFGDSPLNTEDLINMVGGVPLVIKLLEGTHGCGVLLAETDSSAKGIIATLKQMEAKILLQEYIEESKGNDLRCFVIGNKVVAAIQRVAKEGEFRANIHLGASCESVKLTKEERKMAVDAAKVMGLSVAGVDLIRSNRGPLVLEVNSSPGLEGIETATGCDVAGKIIEHIEINASQHGPNKRVSA